MNMNVWNNHIFELWIKIELYEDHRSEGVSTLAVEKKKPEKIQAWTGIEPMTWPWPMNYEIYDQWKTEIKIKIKNNAGNNMHRDKITTAQQAGGAGRGVATGSLLSTSFPITSGATGPSP